MAIPAGMMIRKYGTRNGVVTGLIVFGGAALSFVLSHFFGEYIFWFYLLLLFVIGCGLVCLEVAANPYVTLLGDPETAASRINRAQSFNGMGCIFGALIGGVYCFFGDSPNISVLYISIGIVVLLVAIVFSRIKLPEFVIEDNSKRQTTEQSPAGAESSAASHGLMKHPMYLFGLFALFCYEVSEIAINSFFINYATENNMAQWIGEFIERVSGMALEHSFVASLVLTIGLFLFMCGRFAGSWIMSFIRAE
jgi:FHS family L-fucose permease-like MFS transporter